MKNQKVLTLTEARKNIFSLADSVQKNNVHYTLTDRGKPKAVLLSIERFDSFFQKNNAGFSMVRDGASSYSQQVQVRTLIVRDESKVIYMPESNWDSAKKGEELIRAQLYVNLIEKYQYPLHLVEFGRYVKVGHAKSKRYIEADIIINDEAGNARMILEVGNFEEFEENRDRIVADLFDLARAVTCVKKPNFLVYFSRSCKGGQVRDKISVIDYTKFNTFLSWKKAKRPSTEEIPRYV
ncbi:MAG: type II toxin-antitoxin system prevent-host-death family antitoxin [Candidatus Moranbacteria bacterium]|jgi:prevent-host-death family protein|nr:type II toxin-antitoxin system prevent-host-death family antitoxin [Candidatus Moranbacteria bacterium]